MGNKIQILTSFYASSITHYCLTLLLTVSHNFSVVFSAYFIHLYLNLLPPDPIRSLLHTFLLHVSALVLSMHVVKWVFLSWYGTKHFSFSPGVQLVTPSQVLGTRGACCHEVAGQPLAKYSATDLASGKSSSQGNLLNLQ